MEKLNGVLRRNFTAEDYLAHQRRLNEARIDNAIKRVLENRDNEEYILDLEKRAELIMANMLKLPGTKGKPFFVGTPPAWNECRSGDEEYLWVLNRTGFFNVLTELYVLKGEEKYAEKVLADIDNWIDECPVAPLPNDKSSAHEVEVAMAYFSGLTPWRSLEVGMRAFDSWNISYDRLLLSPLMTPRLHAKMAYSLHEHAQVLREMSPRYWPEANHNHYIHEMLGLFTIASIFPDFKESADWQSFAVRELVRCINAQFTFDGGQLEGSPHYHGLCLHMFFSFVQSAKEFGVELPQDIIDGCVKATKYILAAIGPDGTLAPIGDSPFREEGANTALRYYQCFGELGETEKIFAIHPENDSRIIPEQTQAQARRFAENAPGEDNLQRQIDQYFARTGWRRDASHFGFICHTPIFNGHAHIDPMSFLLYLKGAKIVVDPSFYTYRECEERKLFKSAEYHSTLTIGERSPFEYTSRWTYSPQAEGYIGRSYNLENVFAVDATHHCYEPNKHVRLCALIGEEIFVVVDDVENQKPDSVQIYYHLYDDKAYIKDGEVYCANSRILPPTGTAAQVVPANVGLAMDISQPSSRLILRDESCACKQYVTLFTTRSDVGGAEAVKTDRGIEFSYTVGGERVSFLWKFNSSLERL